MTTNDDFIRYLLWEKRAGEPVEPLDPVMPCECRICLQEAFARCAEEHPDWFQTKFRRVKGSYRLSVLAYISNAKPCFVVSMQMAGEEGQFAVCLRHLKEWVDEKVGLLTVPREA